MLQLFHMVQIEVMIMTDAVMARDARELQRSLANPGDEVTVSISRRTAEYLARVTKAKAQGHEVIVTHGLGEVTPAEAAMILGISRPQVRKLMDKGLVPFRKVGAHHRIPVDALKAWEESERQRREAALDRLADLQNELGLV
jgi:excisionase family DNA binding protein